MQGLTDRARAVAPAFVRIGFVFVIDQNRDFFFFCPLTGYSWPWLVVIVPFSKMSPIFLSSPRSCQELVS